MSLVMYPAVIEKTRDGFAVFFPDLPCGGAGDTVEAAVADAGLGLAAHLDAARETGLAVAMPTPIDKIRVERDIEEVARILVPYETPAHSVRLNITMDEALLKRVDAVAEREGFTRSGFLANAVRRTLAEGTVANAKKTAARIKAKIGRAAQTGSFATRSASIRAPRQKPAARAGKKGR